ARGSILNFTTVTPTTSGRIDTFAGNGLAGYAGDGGAAVNAQMNGPTGIAVDAAGNLYIADQGNNAIRKVSIGGVITTVAPGTDWGDPPGVAVDAQGNLYVAEYSNMRIVRVSPNGGMSTVASSNCYLPGVAVDASDNIYFPEPCNSRVQKLSP